MKTTILLVDDNDLVRDTLTDSLEIAGYHIVTAACTADIIPAIEKYKPDLILLDVLLPDGNGLSFINKIRENTPAPVIVISAKAELIDTVVGLEMGADDYISKPFELSEIKARIRAHLRRTPDSRALSALPDKEKPGEKKEPHKLSVGPWTLDRAQYQAYDDAGHSAGLTVKEFQLLETLALSPQRVFSREELFRKARGDYANTTERAVDVQIMRLRKKIEQDPQNPTMILSVWGAGYKLEPQPDFGEENGQDCA